MPNTFKATGILSIAKSTEKSVNYEEVLSDSPQGWDRRILRMRLSTDKGPLYLNLRGFKKHDESNVLKFSTFENGAYKGTVSIPFKRRFESDELAKVHTANMLSVDTEKDPNLRRLLRKAKRNGTNTKEQIADKLAASYAKHYTYLSGWDYVEKVKELLDAGHFKNLPVTVKGEINVSIYKDKYYFNYEPTQIYTALEEEERVATSNILFYYDKDCLKVAEDLSEITLNGFIQFYDSKLGDNAFAPYDIVYPLNTSEGPEKLEKRINYLKRRFETNGDTVNVMGLVVQNINYAPKRALSIDDLTEAEKEAIEMGDTTLEKVLSSKEVQVRDHFVRANVYKEVQSKYINRAVETAYRSKDLFGLELDDEDELPF